MKRFFLFFLLCALLFCALGVGVAGEYPSEVKLGSVVVVPIEGQISDAQFFFLRRVIKLCESTKVSALILDINTPGGALSATEEICQALMKTKIPVYSYINPNAASAGALIALATRQIYMAPVSAIGAAAPVMSTGQEMGAAMTAKVTSYYSGYFRSIAKLQGHNPDLVDAFMNMEKEVKVGDKVLNEKGSLLTLSAQEAVEKINGKPILAVGIADDLLSLCKAANLDTSAIAKVVPSGFESLAQWITVLAPLFLIGGMIGAWMEFKTPGFGVAGILAGVCFLLFFLGHYIAGLTGMETLAVFVLGLALVLIEIFFFPGVAFLALAGLGLMLGALLFAMVDFYPTQPLDFSPAIFVQPAINLLIATGATLLLGVIFARFFPDMPLFKRLILHTKLVEGVSIPPHSHTTETAYPPLAQGAIGIAISPLRPAGKAQFGQILADVVTDGEFLEVGTSVRLAALSPALLVERNTDAV